MARYPSDDPLYTTEDPQREIPDPMAPSPSGAPVSIPDPYSPGWWDRYSQATAPDVTRVVASLSPEQSVAAAGAAALTPTSQDTDTVATPFEVPLPRERPDPYTGVVGEEPLGIGPREFRAFDDPARPLSEINQDLRNQSAGRQLGLGDQARASRPPAPAPFRAQDIADRPQTPDTIMRGTLKGFLNPLMWLAMGAGALTKHPALNAINAAASVMEGMNLRDIERTRLNQEKFRRSVKDTQHQIGLEVADLGAVVNNPKLSPEEIIAGAMTVADQYQHPVLKEFARTGNLDGIRQTYEGMKAFAGDLHERRRGHDRAVAQVEQTSNVDMVGQGKMDPPPLSTKQGRAFMAQVEKKYPDYNPETDSPRAKRRAERLELREAGVPTGFDETKPLPHNEHLAISFAEGNKSAATNLPKQTAAMVKSRGAWLADNPDALAEAKGGRPGLTERTKEFAGGMTASQTAGRIEGRIVSALSRAEAAAPIVINLSERVGRSEFPDINSILLSGKQRIGDTSVPEFRTALQTFVLAYGLAIGGGVQGALTVDAARHARELLDVSFTKNQVRGQVRQMLFEIDRELAGAKRGVGIAAGTTGAAPKDREQEAYEWAIQNLNNTQAQQILKKLGL